ncbi:hypothetical protein ABT320_09615 [Streptomyces cellulosae]
MSDTSLVFNLVARDRTEQGLSSARERFDAAATGIGVGAGALLGAGIMQGIGQEQAGAKLAAQLGLTEAESARVGRVAGTLYADAYGDSIETVNTAVGAVMSSIKGMSNASSADLERASQAALNFASTFDVEVDRAVSVAGVAINSGLAANATEAFDLMTAASSKVPAALREDVLDAVDEYGQFFNTLGYDGPQAFSLLVDASKKGQFGIDKAGDAIKEFTVLSTDLSTASRDAYKTIGLDAEEMANKILKGGTSAQGATQQIIDGLLGIKDPATQANTAIALFGTPLEDMNVKDIPAFLQSLKGASGSMDGFAGSAKRSGDALRNNAGTALEEFKRKTMGHLAEVGGGFAKFVMDNQTVFVPLAYTLMGLAGTVLLVKGAMMTYSAVSAVVAGANAVINASTWGVIGNWLRMMAIGIGAYLRIGAAAVASALRTAAAWTGSALVSIGTWIAAVVRAGITAAAQFLLMAGRAVVWAATMAAQWFIAMGPIGWVTAIIIGLVILVIAKWDTIKKYSGLVWSWVTKKVESAVRGVLAAVGWLASLPGRVSAFFSSMRNRAVAQAMALVAWVRGLPGRISAGIGSLGSLLTGKGRAVVQGLWSGISSMGGWIKDKIIGWAKSVIPGPVAKALGIASPSKVTKAQGKWIARGLVDGLTGSSKQVRAASYKLVDIVEEALTGKRRSKALKTINKNAGWLDWLAQRDTKITARLKTANKRLADLVKDRDKLAADVKNGILDAADITAVQGGGPVTGSTILSGLQSKLDAARRFATNLAQLRKQGVRSDLIAQIAQAGAEQGAGAAAALARADKGTIRQINATQANLVAAAGTAGSVAGNAMYGAGIQAARGLVRGLETQKKTIERTMLRLATGMKKSIQKALGIRSPSTVMADAVGQHIPPGVVEGIRRTTPQLDSAMQALVRPELAAQQPTAPMAMAPLMGAQAGGVLRVVVDITGGDGELKKMFRRMVRVDGRGQVQILTGSG